MSVSVKVHENSHSMEKLLVNSVVGGFFSKVWKKKHIPFKNKDSLTKKHVALGGGEVRI